jgi:hypothetical protein
MAIVFFVLLHPLNLSMIYNDLISKNKTLAVIGLGYVGLPIALEFAKKIKVIGFDINEERIQKMQNKIDPSNELENNAFDNTDIIFTSDIQKLKEASISNSIDDNMNNDSNIVFGDGNYSESHDNENTTEIGNNDEESSSINTSDLKEKREHKKLKHWGWKIIFLLMAIQAKLYLILLIIKIR